MAKGKVAKSIERLQKAIAIDPEYLEAHNDLGTRYVTTGQYGKALECFSKALEIDPRSSIVLTNQAVAYFSMQRHKDAEEASRRALDDNSGNMKARYLLGLSLVSQGIWTDEAIDNLERAADEFPNARVAIAQVRVKQGDIADARDHLKAYLDKGKNLENRKAIESWLARLNSGIR
jgi:tetratricopeptide (TPR) repeat protein